MTVEYCPPDDAKHLLRLCEAGRLYEVQEWIRAGRPLQVPPDFRKTPLRVALTAGFHSLIELLLRHENSQTPKNEALAQAVQLRRLDLVELAVKYGADIRSVAFGEVLENWDKGIMWFFIERGAGHRPRCVRHADRTAPVRRERERRGARGDGMKADSAGNIWTSGRGGIYVFSPKGEHIGFAPIAGRVSNCAFGPDRYLYVTNDNTQVVRGRIRADFPGGSPIQH